LRDAGEEAFKGVRKETPKTMMTVVAQWSTGEPRR
jgi:hypothetical protein